MTNEIKNNATSIVTNAIFSAFPEAVNIREGSKNTICIPTSVVDDEGNTIYVSVNVSVKNNKATKRTEAFDFEAAKENYAAYMTEKVEKAAARPAPKNPADSEAAQRREARMVVLRDFFMNKAEPDKGYTSTEVHDLLPEIYADATIMITGTDLKRLYEEGLAEMRMVEGKKNYFTV